MKKVTCIIFVILFLLLLLANNMINAKRILVIMSAPFKSHQIVYRSLCLALHKRGHELVVFTTHPMKNSTLKNYTEISMPYYSVVEQYKRKASQMPMLELIRHVSKLTTESIKMLFNDPKFKEFYNCNQKFDAIIIEQAGYIALNAIAHKFDAPLIGILSLGLHNYHRYIFNSPILSSHLSNWEFNTLSGDQLSIWQRLWNFIGTWRIIHFLINEYTMENQEVVQEYLGKDVPNVINIMKNMSVMLVNENPIYAYSRPEQSNIIFFSGIHIQKTPPPLPNDLRQFLDDATEGYIYVSFGTTITCDALPKEMLRNFVKVFSKLPYKIVWKFECELPGKLDNAFISKWVLQQGVLAHPNIKLFIYQGGLQSTEEALHYAVPLLGIPIVPEQECRILRLVSLGAAVRIKLHEITEEYLNSAIRRILNNKSYKERIMYLSALFKDRPYDSLENVIWWIEYVMRHKGINHLRFNDSDKPWYQRYDMDVIALLSITLFMMECVIALIVIQIIRFILYCLKLSSR